MKKIANKFLRFTANASLEATLISAGLPSLGGAYQPTEPKNLKVVAEKCKNAKNMVI